MMLRCSICLAHGSHRATIASSTTTCKTVSDIKLYGSIPQCTHFNAVTYHVLTCYCSNLPAIRSVTVSLHREPDKKKKRDKNQASTQIGYVTIPISDLSSRQIIEKW